MIIYFPNNFNFGLNPFYNYSITIIDQENQILLKPISYILHSYFFSILNLYKFVSFDSSFR